jgi:hypothetical protein
MKQYRVINLENENQETHEYTIIVEMNANGHEETTLCRSLNDAWSDHVRGEELIKVIDTGDMMVFPKKQFSGDVGYDSLAELFIIMSFISKTNRFPLYKGRIEEFKESQNFEI